MALTNEEIAADLTWHYVEHLRERAAAGNCEALSAAELTELRRALETAGTVPGALAAEPASVEARERLRARLEADLGVSPAPSPATSSPRSGPAGNRPFGAWAFLRNSILAGTAGALLGLAAAMVSVGIWHPTPAPVRMVDRPANVAPISEQTAHALIPAMVENRLPPGEERNLMWHMLVCPGCFEEYVQRRGHQRVEAPVPPILVRMDQVDQIARR